MPTRRAQGGQHDAAQNPAGVPDRSNEAARGSRKDRDGHLAVGRRGTCCRVHPARRRTDRTRRPTTPRDTATARGKAVTPANKGSTGSLCAMMRRLWPRAARAVSGLNRRDRGEADHPGQARPRGESLKVRKYSGAHRHAGEHVAADRGTTHHPPSTTPSVRPSRTFN